MKMIRQNIFRLRESSQQPLVFLVGVWTLLLLLSGSLLTFPD
jgi:hypothetical protein